MHLRAALPAVRIAVLMGAAVLSTPTARAQDRSWPQALRHATQRTADVEWRLHKAAGRACPITAAATGLILDGIDSFSEADREMVARELRLGDAIQIAAVAHGSPAAAAGILAGDDLVAVNGSPLLPQRREEADTRPEKRPRALLAMELLAAVPTDQPIRLTLRRAGRTFGAELVPQAHCASRVFVDTKNTIDAYTDGVNIIVTARMVDFTQSQDELAILIGHELGHVMGRDGKERSIGERRRMEDRADILGADLAACAGYDVKAAAPFWRRLEKQNPLRFFGIRLQSSGQARVRNVASRPAPTQCPIVAIPPLQE